MALRLSLATAAWLTVGVVFLGATLWATLPGGPLSTGLLPWGAPEASESTEAAMLPSDPPASLAPAMAIALGPPAELVAFPAAPPPSEPSPGAPSPALPLASTAPPPSSAPLAPSPPSVLAPSVPAPSVAVPSIPAPALPPIEVAPTVAVSVPPLVDVEADAHVEVDPSDPLDDELAAKVEAKVEAEVEGDLETEVQAETKVEADQETEVAGVDVGLDADLAGIGANLEAAADADEPAALDTTLTEASLPELSEEPLPLPLSLG